MRDAKSFGLDEWRSFAVPFFDVVPTGPRDSYRAFAKSSRLGRLVVSEVRFDSAVFDRDPRRLSGFDTEFLLLESYEAGTNRGRTGDIVTGLDTGAVHIVDMSRPWRSQTSAVACRSIVIPHELIGYDPSIHPAYTRLDSGSPRNAMVRSGMRALFDADRGLGPQASADLIDGFGSLVQRLMFNRHDRDAEFGRPEGQAPFLRKFIEQHLADLELGPQRICEAIGLSRSTLYRIFPEDEGVRGYIIARRLERCFDELRQSAPRRGRVREVAERWGFFDPKSFNRAFRSRFGIAPSECMEAPLGSAEAQAHPVHRWLRKR